MDVRRIPGTLMKKYNKPNIEFIYLIIHKDGSGNITTEDYDYSIKQYTFRDIQELISLLEDQGTNED